MNHKTLHLFIIFFACTVFIFSSAAAVSIQMTPSSLTVQKGTTSEISLKLDDAPAGLAGYDLVIRFSNPAVAEISDVTYPSWAALNNITRNADGSVRIGGVDLSRQVSPGATDVLLATLTIRALSGGSSSISLESVNMDADGGDVITPSLSTGQIVIPGSYVPSGGGGGGGGDGGGFISTTTKTLTPKQTPSPVPTLEETQPTSMSQETVVTPVVMTSATTMEQTVLSNSVEVPGDNGSFPWIWIVGAVVIIGILFIGSFVAWRKEQD
jgi:hypothetical protein